MSVLRDIVWKQKIGGRHCLAVAASILFETIMAALRPKLGHSHRRRLDLKAAVRSARHNGEKIRALRIAEPPPTDDR